jgi:hypothetical protein
MSRQGTIQAIEQEIGHRHLIWVGTRGTDAQPLLCIDQFCGVFCLISPLGVPSWATENEVYLENISRHRVDLNIYAIDDDKSVHLQQLHRNLRDALMPGTLIAAYRPTAFLAAAYYPRINNCSYLGMFHGSQAAYEHKPWVETELAEFGINIIPWRYFCDDDRLVMLEWMEGKSCVLRSNYSDGGAGLTLVRADQKIEDIVIPKHHEIFFAVAPLLEPTIPLNVSGCVFPDGTVTVRHPSIQLIGIPECTNRSFGYCGNDFSSVRDILEKNTIHQLESLVQRTGQWLYIKGYRGAFGVDVLIDNGDTIYLTEINPRFQGSSAVAALSAAESGLEDIYLDHLSAFLDIPPQTVSLWEQICEQANQQDHKGQIICYNTGNPKQLYPDSCAPDLDYGDIKGIPGQGITVDNEAMLFKILVAEKISQTGFDLPQHIAFDIPQLIAALYQTIEQENAN